MNNMNLQDYLASPSFEFHSEVEFEMPRPLKRCFSNVSSSSSSSIDSDDESVGPAFQKYKSSSPPCSSSTPEPEVPCKKGAWSEDEDEKLFKNATEILFSKKKVIKNKKPKRLDWRAVARFIPLRNSKQCRERWVNHLDPSIVRGGWSADEDRKLMRMAVVTPNQWAKLAREMPGRTENMVKVRFHTLMRMKNKNLQTATEVEELLEEEEEEEEEVTEVPPQVNNDRQNWVLFDTNPLPGCSAPIDDTCLFDPYAPMPYVNVPPTADNSFELFEEFFFQEEPICR